PVPAEGPKNNEDRVIKPLPPQPTSAEISPLFGPAFGALYDISAILILCLAGASATISLRDLLPHYLTRYGMEMHWAQRIGVLLHLFNVLVLIAVIAFHARVSHQQGAYAVSVLVLLTAAAAAALVDVVSRGRRSFGRDLVVVFLFLVGAIFLALACWNCYDNPAGLVIALLFVVVMFFMAGLSRWMRSTELRYYGFTFADEESGIRWEQIRRLEFQVLAPHRPDHLTLADKEADLRARHRLGPEAPIIFIEAMLGDPSDFQQHPLMRIVKQDGREVIRVWQCASIAHVLAAIALEFREVGQPPEIHFAWSGKSPLASNLNFLLWGQGNIPWLVHTLIRKAEPDPTRQPRVVIG
ncbi:MAG: amino acid transporter, partial [Gemmataceae bacterium]